MRAPILVLLILAAAPAAADECDELAARIAVATPMQFERRTGLHIHFKGPAPLDVLTVHCPEPGFRASVGLFSNDTALPPATFFDTAAVVSALALGLSRDAIRADAILCQRRALKGADGDATFDRPSYQATCSVGRPSRDPGGSKGSIGVVIFKTR